MGWLKRFKNYLGSLRRSWWEHFSVQFDERQIRVTEIDRFKKVTERKIAWEDVKSVCFKDSGLGCDVFYLFSEPQDNPILVPVEAKGGTALWEELKKRNLFPAEISEKAVRSTGGETFWWPPRSDK